MKTQDYTVKGMTCPNCVRHVKQAFEKIAGVKQVQVQLENGAVHIEYDENLKLNELEAALTNTSYEIV